MKPMPKLRAAILSAALLAPPGILAQTASTGPSQAQLDQWAVEVIRYCTPEIRQLTSVLENNDRRAMQRSGYSKADQEWAWRANAQTRREGRVRILAQLVSWSIAPPDYVADLESIYKRPLGINRDASEEQRAAQTEESRARRDVEYCMRSRAIELEFPDYKRW